MRRIIFSIMLVLVLMPGLAVATTLESDLEIVSFEALGVPEEGLEVPVNHEFDLALEKVVTNNGPSGPTDGELTTTWTVPTGSSVTTGITFPILVEELAVGEQRRVLEKFSFIVGDTGLQTFTFTNVFEVVGDASDPDLENNYLSLDLHLIGVTSVPEPATIFLIGTGLVGLVGFRRKFKT